MDEITKDHPWVVEESHDQKDSKTIRRPKKNHRITIDKEFEEIAKIEVDAFLNQGKILTDKNLRQVEKSIKERWLSKRGISRLDGIYNYQSKQNLNKKNIYSNFYSKTKRDATSLTPNINWDLGANQTLDNVYVDKGREGNRWSNILSRNKNNIVNQLTDKLNNSRNQQYFGYCKSNNRYTYNQENERVDSCCKINAQSCEKLPPKSKLDTSMLWNQGNSRNEWSMNSITVDAKKGNSTMTTPSRTAYNKSWLQKNRSSSKLNEINKDHSLHLDAAKILNEKNNIKSRCIYTKEMNRTLDEGKPYESSNECVNRKLPIGLNHSYQNLQTKDNDSSTLSGLSLKDEWTEIQLYNGILSKMRKDHEHMLK